MRFLVAILVCLLFERGAAICMCKGDLLHCHRWDDHFLLIKPCGERNQFKSLVWTNPSMCPDIKAINFAQN